MIMRKIKQIMRSAFVLTLIFWANNLLAQTTQTFTSSGTFTVPAGVYSVKVEAWGGGGAGGGVDGASGTYRAGGGGGGGAFVLNNSVSVTPGNNITVTVGAGGTGVTAADGNPGGQSSFGGLVNANGGAGGKVGKSGSNAGAGGAGATGTYNGGNGAAAATGFFGYSGGGGGGAGSTGNGGDASTTTGGAGGTGGGGTGADGLFLATGNGSGATALSAGGSGGRSKNSTDRTGGNGFRGQVRVTYCVTYSLTSTSGVTPICVSTSQSDITLNGMLPVGSYTVTYDRSLPAATGLTASMTVTSAGTGTFTATGLTSTGNCDITVTHLTESGCDNSISVNNTTTINVIDIPSQPDPITGAPTSVCPNPTDGPYSLSTSATGATSYHWYLNPSTTGVNFLTADGSSSIDVEFGTTVNSTYVIRVEASNSCGTSAYRSVMVRRTVSTPASVIGNAVACANTNNVAYSCTPVSGADSYEWTISGDATVTGTTENVTVNFGPAWTGGTLCVAAKVGCFTSSTKCMTLSPSITPAAIGAITGTFTACPNAVQTYSVANISGATYNWTTPSNSNITQGAGTNSVEVTFQNNYNNVGNICVTVVSGCGVSTGPKCKTIAPTVPKRPVSITGTSSGLCNGNVSYSVAPQAGMNFQWTTPGTIIGPNNTETINVQYGVFIKGQVCVSAYNACGSSATRCIPVKGAPVAAASITPGLACANQNVTFTADTTNIQGDFTLTWMYPNTATYVSGGGNTNDITVTWGAAAGNVILMSSNACGSASKVKAVALDNCRFGEENSQASAFSVYPNPVNDVLNLSFMAEKNSMVSVQLFDYSGKLIQKDSFSSEKGLNVYQANLSKFAPGLYIISITTENGVMQGKFMKN